MGGDALFGGWLELAAGLSEFALQWLVQSTLVIAAGLTLAALLRHRAPALRSVVYHTTLIAALASPLAAYFLSSAGLTFLTLELPSPLTERMELVAAPPAPTVPTLLSEPASPITAASQVSPEALADDDSATADPIAAPLTDSFPPEISPQGPPVAASPVIAPSDYSEATNDPSALSTPPAPAASIVRRIVVVRPVVAAMFLAIPIAWSVVTLVLLARLLIDHLRLARVRRVAQPVDEHTLRICQDLAGRLHVSSPRLLRSPFVSSPCLSGVLCPTILLPEELDEASLSAVLVHELAHRKRNDCLWNLLRHVGTALVWPQPLVWQLSHRMEAAAEDVCDDYVVEFGESRAAYAETLLALAERNLLPASGAAVSLITFRSMLGQRVQRILDQTRRLTLTVGLAALTLVAAGGVSAALVAGLLGPKSSAVPTETKSDQGEQASTTPPDVSGRCLTPAGEPATAAHVVLLARSRTSFSQGSLDQSSEIKVLDQAKVDDRGRFVLSGEKLDDGPYLWVQVVAKAPGYGLVWHDVNVLDKTFDVTLSLPSPQNARGRLVDAEGHGAANVSITVMSIGQGRDGQWDGVDSMRAALPPEIWPERITSDADGWFEVPEVPAGTELSLFASQEPFAPCWWRWKTSDPSQQVQVLDPAQIITGVVVAADTGQPIPLAGLTVFQDKRPGGMMGRDGQADDQGRFRLNPYAADAYTVSAFAASGTPYLARQIKFDWPSTATAHELRIELTRGVLVQGRLLEQGSGEPVAGASVQYEPRALNKFATDDLVTGWQATAVSDSGGRYSIAVPPGGGSLRVLAPNRKYAVRQTNSQLLYDGREGGRRLYLHAFRLLDFASEAREQTVDMQLVRGRSVRAEVVGPDGQPAESLCVAYAGADLPYHDDFGDGQEIPGSRFEIDSVPPDGELTVFLLDPVKKNGRLVTLRGRDAEQTTRIELQPCGSATLRMVDAQGQPVRGVGNLGLNLVFTPGASVFERDATQPLADETYNSNFDRRNYWDLKSGEGGRFQFTALIPGVEYQLFGSGPDKQAKVERSFRVKPGEHLQLADYVIHDPSVLDDAERNRKAMAADATQAAVAENPSKTAVITAPADGDLVTVRGTVLDPNGKPIAGAEVAVVRWHWHKAGPRTPLSRTRKDAAGQFTVAYRKSQFDTDFGGPEQWRDAAIVATHPGFGPDWKYYSELAPGEPAALKLVEDHPISGRIVDLEGQPVAGASLQIKSVYHNNQEDISRWVDAMRKGIPYFGSEKYDRPESALPTEGISLGNTVTTDQDGRFEIRGVGRSRYANLKLKGAGIAVAELRVVTLPIESFEAEFGQANFKNPLTYFGARFEFSAEPSQPVEGVVRDAISKQPLAGVRVIADKLAGGKLSGLYAAETTTDAEGRYRLDGLPKGEGNGILAVPSDELPYFMREFRDVPTGPGLAPVTFDLDLHRGIWIRGRLSEKESGACVRARLFYLPWPDNPHIKELPEFNSGHLHGSQSRYETDQDGGFRLVGLPGRGLVAAVCIDKPYPTGQGLSEIADLPPKDAFRKVVGVFAPTELHPTAVHEIRPDENAQQTDVDFRIDSGKSLALRFVDDAGQPLSGLQVEGLWPKSLSHRAEGAGPAAEVLALKSDEKRLILAHDAKRQLGKVIEVQWSDASDGRATVTLESCARLKVRLLDADQKPLAGVQIRCRPLGENDFGRELPAVSTDDNGVVDTPTLLPGCRYDISAESPQFRLQTLVKDLQISPGETIDLGEFDVTSDARPEPRRTPLALAEKAKASERAVAVAQVDAPAKSDAAPRVLRGTVLDPSRKPAAGVRVRVFVLNTAQLWGDTTEAWQEATPPDFASDAAGRFTVDLGKPNLNADSWPEELPLALVVATSPGAGPAWMSVNKTNVGKPVDLRLVEDQPITVRLVDLEGQPIVGARVDVPTIETNEQEDLSEWLAALHGGMTYRAAESKRGTRKSLGFSSRWGLEGRKYVDIHGTTDADGRVTLAGVGRGRLANLLISGPGIVTTRTRAFTLPMEPIDVNMHGASVPVQQRFHGADFSLSLENSAPIEGIVRDADSGEPLAGVRVVSNRFAGTNLIQNYLVQTTSDAQGHYRLDGMPSGKGNNILAIPTDDQPYFLREFNVPTTQPLTAAKLDLELHRGVWIEGTVRDVDTKEPVLGHIYYLPWPDHPRLKDLPELTRRSLPGPQDQYHTDTQGRYRIVGLPGRGLVELHRMMNLASTKSYPIGQGLDQIADLPSDEAFGITSQLFPPRSVFITAVKEVNTADEGITTADLELREGDRIALRLVDPAGQPVSGAQVRGLSPPGQYYKYDNLGPTVEVAGLAAGEKRRVVVEQRERRLGKGFDVSVASDGRGPRDIRLEPFATITGRLTSDGEPVRNALVWLSYKAGPNFVERLESATDAEGRFTHDAVPAGVEFEVLCEGVKPSSTAVATKLTAAGGETIDLGDVDLSKKERPEPKRTPAATAKPTATAAAVPTPPAANNAAPLVVRGVVLDPLGKPVAKVPVELSRSHTVSKWAKDIPRLKGETDAAGRFEFEVPNVLSDGWRSGRPWPLFGVLAKPQGFAQTHVRLHREEDLHDVVVRLTPFAPLEGRIVNLEGQPVPGVNVHLHQVEAKDRGNLEPWLAALRKGTPASEVDEAIKSGLGWGDDDLRKANQAVTDADGRFRLNEVGRHHVALLKLSGSGIVSTTIEVANAPTAPLALGDHTRKGDSATLYGSPFKYAAEPSRPIVGVVKDAETGKPIAGVKISSSRYESLNAFGFGMLETVSDEQGRYRLDGLRAHPTETDGHRIVVRSTGDLPYLVREFDPPEGGDNLNPVPLDIELHRGVWIEGRVTDAVTGKPVEAKVAYLPWYDNPRVDNLPEYQGNGRLRLGSAEPNTDADGRYKLIGIRGRGLVQIEHVAQQDYPMGQGFDRIPDLAGAAKKFERLGLGNTPQPQYVVAVQELNVTDDVAHVTADFSLVPGATVKLSTVDSDNQPVEVTQATGLVSGGWVQLHRELGSQAEVRGVTADETRTVLLLNVERRLGAMVAIRLADDPALERKVTLLPLATITSRLVDAEGEPITGLVPQDRVHLQTRISGQLFRPFTGSVDASGRIELLAVGAPLDYEIYAEGPNKTLIEQLRVEPGETIDLGTIDVTSKQRPPIKRTPATTAAMVVPVTGTFQPGGIAGAPPVATGGEALRAIAPDEIFEFRGKVVDAAGRPAAGAEVYLSYYTLAPAESAPPTTTRPQAVADADGAFAFKLKASDIVAPETSTPWNTARLVAKLPGQGMGWLPAAACEPSGRLRASMPAATLANPDEADRATEDFTIKLVADDVPLRGRIVNLEGQPIEGATVRVIQLLTNRQESLDPWLKVAESVEGDYYAASRAMSDGFRGLYVQSQLERLIPAVKSDADGRFQISGLGRERMAQLQIEPPGYETRQVYARTRPGKTIELRMQRDSKDLPDAIFHGAEFVHVAAPSPPVEGVVRDWDTGAPLAGVSIRSHRLAGNPLTGWSQGFIRTTTDAEGRYRLNGMPIGENEVILVAPADKPYVCSTARVTLSLDKAPPLDPRMKRGVWIEGRAADVATGKPVRGQVQYYAFNDNPHLRPDGARLRLADSTTTTDADGRYRLAGLPGRGLITFLVSGTDVYPRSAGVAEIKGGRVEDQDFLFNTSPYYVHTANGHVFREINPAQGAQSIECNLALDAGPQIAGIIVDGDGQPLSGCEMVGEVQVNLFRSLRSAEFVVRHLRPGEKRRVLFHHAKRQLAGSLVVRGEDAGPLKVTLVPSGTITGRLVDDAGVAIEEAFLYAGSGNDEDKSLRLNTFPRSQRIFTGADGRFTITGLAPGVKYTAVANQNERFLGTVFEDVTVESGQTRDLGDVKPSEKASAVAVGTAVPNEQPAPVSRVDANVSDDMLKFAGQVVGPDGKPQAGANVTLPYRVAEETKLVQAITAADGSFTLEVPREGFVFEKNAYATIAVVADGLGFTWEYSAPFEGTGQMVESLKENHLHKEFVAKSANRVLRLVVDQPVSGRLVNLEGQPVAGAQVRVASVHANHADGLEPWLSSMKSGEQGFDQGWRKLPDSFHPRDPAEGSAPLFPLAVTDAEGRFTINRLGRNRLVNVEISGKGIESRHVWLRTQPGDVLEVARDASDPSRDKQTLYAADFVYPAAPSLPLVGVVRDADTGQPLAGVQITPEEIAGRNLGGRPYPYLQAVTDAAGRYRLEGLPIGENEIAAVPTGDQPYPPVSIETEISATATEHTLDFQLKRGIWIRGRVTDGETGEPVVSRVQYLPFSDNENLRVVPGLFRTLDGKYTGDDGRFQVVAMRGHGLLTMMVGNNYEKYPRGAGVDKIAGASMTEHVRTFPYLTAPVNTHYLAELQVDATAESIEHDIQLHAGNTRPGTVLDPQGNPLSGVQCAGLASGGFWDEIENGAFVVRHLEPGQKRRLTFYHEPRKLAASIEVSGDETTSLVVKLEPGGAITGRVRFASGDPAARVMLGSMRQKTATTSPAGILPGPRPHLTDGEGRFTIAGLAPGMNYSLRAVRGGYILGTAIENAPVAAGETKDLGDLVIPDPEN